MVPASQSKVTITRPPIIYQLALLSAFVLMVLPASKAKAQSASSNFNLGSAARSTTNNALTNGQSATITRGGTTVTFKAGSALTAAERVAINQVLDGGPQTLVLSKSGTAIGGNFDVASDLSSKISGLNVPRGVTGMLNFSQQAELNLTGNLVNSGSVFGFSTNPAISTGTLSALNIINNANGLISSVLPNNFMAAATALPNFNLVLQAVNNISNYGTITSSGSLTLVAGNTISNSLQTVTQTNQALMQAQTNINIITNHIINSSNITSLAGNLNLTAANSNAMLQINNTSGVLKALMGDININNLTSSAISGIALTGGSALSQNLNLDAGSGIIAGQMGEVTGWINMNACKAEFGAATSNLKLGSLNITGDPTFYNTAGDLTLADIKNTNGNALALIASRDVIVTSGTLDTTRTTSAGTGGDLTIIAGANVTGGTSSTTGDTTTTLTINPGGSASGGGVDLTGVTSINTSATMTTSDKANAGGNGGDILIVAFAGSKTGTLDPGTVNMGNAIVNTSAGGGWGGNISGSFTVIAGATADPSGGAAVRLSPIFTGADPFYSQSGSSGGDIKVLTQTPVVTGKVTVFNGALTFGSGASISGGTTQNASIDISSTGGGATIDVQNTLAQWQIDQISLALDFINTKRLAEQPTFAAFQLDLGLSLIAQQQAQYLALTGHLGHRTVLGDSLGTRAKAIGISGSLAENAAFGIGYGINQGYVTNSTNMFSESNSPGTHHYNYVGTGSNKYIGIGLATNGNALYFVENFSTAPTTATTTTKGVPIHGGLAGQAGNVPVTSSDKTVQTIGGAGFMPLSIFSNGNVTLTAGNSIKVAGTINANGRAAIQYDGSGLPQATDGGKINITAGGNIDLYNLQAGGGSGGGEIAKTFAGGAGGAAGTINITSTNGNISVLPISTNCSACIAIAAQGGAGGQTSAVGTEGGAGGAGGSVTLSALNGSIVLSAIEVGGGGGGGGAGGATTNSTGGAGGVGGKGGSISLTAKNSVTVQNYLSASGGGGGGAGGSGTTGGGGGGGGSLGMPGFGGMSGSDTSGGGGAGGGQAGAFGGAAAYLSFGVWYANIVPVINGNGVSGTGKSGAGGAAGILGGGGVGGTGPSGTGGNGGDIGLAGSASGAVPGGAAGAGGSIALTGGSVLMQGTVSGFWGSLSAKNSGSSLLALGSNGTVNITTAGGGSATTYNASVDLSSKTTFSTPLGNPAFVVGSTAGGNGTAGAIEAGTSLELNKITINGISSNSPLTSGSFGGGGGTSVFITKNSTPVLFDGSSKATAAELVAIAQVVLFGPAGQTLTIDADGLAIGGTLDVDSINIPAGGFTTLVLPSTVTLFDKVSNLIFATSTTVNGTLEISGVAGTATITTPLLTLGPSANVQNNAAGNLSFQSPGTGQQLSIALGTASKISTSNGNISFNPTSAGAVLTSTALQGSISAGGAGSQVSFNGGSSSVDVSVDSITGIVGGSGVPFKVSTNTGSLTTGNITSTGAVSLSANTGITGTGLISAFSLSLLSKTSDLGSVGSPFLTKVAELSVDAAGSATISNTGSITLKASTAGTDFTLNSSGILSVSAELKANQITLAATASDTGLIIDASLTGTGAASKITLIASGAGTIAQSAGLLKADTVSFKSDTGSIGSNAPIAFDASTVTANSGGKSNVFLSAQSGVSVGNSSAGDTFWLTANGAISTSGTISAPNVKLETTSNGSITVNDAVGQLGGSVNLLANGSGTISGTGSILGNSVILSSGTGTLGTAGNALNTNASTLLSVNTGASSVINNTIPAGSKTLNLGSSAVPDLSITSNSSIATTGTLTATNLTLTTSAANGAITLNDDVTVSGTATLSTNGSGAINQNAGKLTTPLLVLSSLTGDMDLGNGASILAATTINVSTGGSVSLNNTVATTLSGVSVGGTFTMTDAVSITTSGNLSFGSGSITTPLLINSKTLTATGVSGTLQIQSPDGSSLLIQGDGTYDAPGGITFTGTNGSMDLSGNMTFPATTPGLILNASDALQVSSGTLNISKDLTVNSGHIFNPGGFVVGGIKTFNVEPQSGAIGTIVNTSGDVVLTKNTIINSSGKSVLILASGNVFASGVSSINLSNSKGKGGSLVVIAGVDSKVTAIDLLAGGVTVPTHTVTGVSGTGGSINLAKTAINTSSTATTGNTSGGNVTLVANAVAGQSAGVVLTGAINTSSSKGKGGNVSVFAPGGIVINGAITTKGVSAGGSVLLAATPFTNGIIEAYNGYLTPTANFKTSAASSGATSSITVGGSILTQATAGNAGSVTLSADSHVLVKGMISASAQKKGGGVSLSSLNGSVTVNGNISTNGLAASSSATAGSAGAISIQVAQFVTVKGSLNASGGSTTKANQNAGSGAQIILQTTKQGVLFTGNILVTGFINSAGGNASSSPGGGKGGSAGSVTIDAGAMQVKGATSGASILASGGKGLAGAGSAAKITLSTAAVQPIPANFNLLSTTKSEYALPGALFTTGNATVNGTSGNIVSGSDVLNKTSAGSITLGATQGRISIAVNGSSQNINIGGVPNNLIGPGTASARTKVTPAVALALHQVALGKTQTLGIIAGTQQASGLNPGGGVSKLSLSASDLPQTFTSFILQASGTANGVQLDITGSAPVLKLPSATIDGALTFSTSNFAAVTASALTLTAGAQMTAPATLALASAKITNSGTINAASVLMLQPNTTVSWTNTATGQMIATALSIPSGFAPATLNLTNNSGGKFSSPVTFQAIQLATGFASTVPAMTTGSTQTSNAKLNFNLAGTSAHLAGTYNSSGKLNITTSSVTINKVLTPTDLTIDAGSSINTNTGVTISSSGKITQAAGSSISNNIGAIKISAKGTAFLDGDLSAGVLNGTPGIKQLTSQTDIKSSGSISVAAPTVDMGTGANFTSTGGNLTVQASAGNLDIGSNNQLTANGGNLIMLATGSVTGTTGNTFVAMSTGKTAQASSGGGIEIGAGVKAATLSSALSNKSGTVPSASLGSNVFIDNNSGGNGVVKAPNSNIDLSTSGKVQATLDLNKGGAIVFDAVGPNTVSLDGASFTVAAFKPIGYTETANTTYSLKPACEQSNDKITGEDDGQLDLKIQKTRCLAHLFIPGMSGAQQLSAKEPQSADSGTNTTNTKLKFHRGEIFLCPQYATTISTEFADVTGKKGALFLLAMDNTDNLRVVNCGVSGDVSISVAGRSVSIAAGEEVIVSRKALSDDEIMRADGIGRRNFTRNELSKELHFTVCDVSIITVLGNLQYLETLKRPQATLERKIQARMLKTASALNVVTDKRGNYRAKPPRPSVPSIPENHRSASAPMQRHGT